MAYQKARELFENPNADPNDLLEAFENLCIDFGHIACSAEYGIRKEAEADLLRTLYLMKALKLKLKHSYHD